MPGLTPQEKDEYSRGATISGAKKGWRARGSIGVVTSSMSSASEQSQQENYWHTVAMARQGSKVCVHDLAYVHRLIQQWPSVPGAYFRAHPSAIWRIQDLLECMGRSAQCVDATVSGTLLWPPNSSSLGEQWTFQIRN
jgi:hypothetical protein